MNKLKKQFEQELNVKDLIEYRMNLNLLGLKKDSVFLIAERRA